MAKKAFIPRLLNLSTRNYPAPIEHVVDITRLDGGLNTWEQNYKLPLNQSPDMENMWWNDGALMSRTGQSYVHYPVTTTGVTTVQYQGAPSRVIVTNYMFDRKLHGDGDYVFTFDASPSVYSWTYDGAPVKLEDYGILIYAGSPVDGDTVTVTSEADTYGTIFTCYEQEWEPGYLCLHAGSNLYKVNNRTGEFTAIADGALSLRAGHFFVQDSYLYYFNGPDYLRISEAWAVTRVEGYVPVTVVNRYPNGTGGDQYQPENRIAAGKRVWFTAHKEASETDYPTEYVLPYQNLDAEAVTIEGTVYENNTVVQKTYQEVQLYDPNKAGTVGIVYLDDLTSPMAACVWQNNSYVTTTVPESSTVFTVNRETGVITFNTAPTNTDAEMVSNIKVKLAVSNPEALASIANCQAWTVFSVEGLQTVICGGCPEQPNAFFWSGGNDIDGSDPSYFPMDYYNIAGSADTAITAFGKQQNLLVIFKERSVGKSSLSVETISGRNYVSLSYISINEAIGCDLPKSVQLVINNLVFANTYGGVFMLLDTSAAGENALARLSRNVNGSDTTPRLLYDLQVVDRNTVTSYDDDKRYWLTANGHAYVWDYRIKFYSAAYPNEEKLSWFYFTNINPLAWMYTTDTPYFVMANGSVAKFGIAYADFGLGFPRKYTYSTQNFGTYERLKNVTKVIFALTSDTNTAVHVTYNTDYEERRDRTDLMVSSWSLVPRNLAFRDLNVTKYAGTCVRKPRCYHVRHFAITLSIDEAYKNMSLVGAQIYYNFGREDR